MFSLYVDGYSVSLFIYSDQIHMIESPLYLIGYLKSFAAKAFIICENKKLGLIPLFFISCTCSATSVSIEIVKDVFICYLFICVLSTYILTMFAIYNTVIFLSTIKIVKKIKIFSVKNGSKKTKNKHGD